MGYCLTKIKLSQGFSVAKHHCLVDDNNSQLNLFVWDPTEPVATRPLFMLSNPGNYKFFYTFDGNKNVSERVHFESRNGIAVHYDYAPFGAVTRATNTSAISARNFHLENPFRFSSEYHDDTLALVYYNYRHYNPIDGRWCGRDLIEEVIPYLQCKNSPIGSLDINGLWVFSIGINLTGSVLGGGTISFGIAISYDKENGTEMATYVSSGMVTSLGIPSGSMSIQAQYSNSATTVNDLSGESCVVGGSASFVLSVGVDISFPLGIENGYKFTSVTIGTGTPTSEAHVSYTETTIWKYRFKDCKMEEGATQSRGLIKMPPGFYLGVM